ncbi:MAG TPA: hypothetical protein VLB27_02260, partial [candidate division Zixibacteria bacterium]|nr:hypothetical protein [candidate division Zixibacteria bacterium]
KGARFGVKIADLTTTFLSYDSGRKESIAPHVNIAAQYAYPVLTEGLVVTAAAEAETYFENRRWASQYWRGDVSCDLHLGLEANYRDRVFGRLGSDAGVFAAGAGFAVGRWGVDAALTDHEFLDNSYRISLRFMWE